MCIRVSGENDDDDSTLAGDDVTSKMTTEKEIW